MAMASYQEKGGAGREKAPFVFAVRSRGGGRKGRGRKASRFPSTPSGSKDGKEFLLSLLSDILFLTLHAHLLISLGGILFLNFLVEFSSCFFSFPLSIFFFS